MEYKLSRYGAVSMNGENFDDQSFTEPHVKLTVPGAISACTVKLGPLLYVTTFYLRDGEQHYVTLFKYHGKCKPRCVEISELLDIRCTSEKKLMIFIFGVLLGFDHDRLSNRDRNTLLAGIRYNLPPVFVGTTLLHGFERGFYVNNDQLTIFTKVSKDAGVLIRTGYSLFSRNIKDSLK
ncbi:hypothetical protein OBP_255 [Pseudomonas phage OBP]|uniref:hypothetical protein n=1 Tax=Pseudomonas phage OBP TaxID=1124849 RepID=UPI000240D5E8|nr:hypothetical protein OBP_255 [Pseudomonas phage OBP]AEV89692.1 hypothetical protein OBP_255 [Pseudomonas phage OBP]